MQLAFKISDTNFQPKSLRLKTIFFIMKHDYLMYKSIDKKLSAVLIIHFEPQGDIIHSCKIMSCVAVYYSAVFSSL